MSGPDITLPSAVLRSKAITLMGSGIGSVAASRLVAAIGELLQATAAAGFKIAAQPTPLADVEKAWTSKGSDRLVFIPDAHTSLRAVGRQGYPALDAGAAVRPCTSLKGRKLPIRCPRRRGATGRSIFGPGLGPKLAALRK